MTPRDGRSGNQRGRRHGRAGAGLVATLALVTGLSACTTDARLSQITVSAVFPDVNGLVSGAQVQEADIPVGHVTGISLDGSKARVTMVIERGAQVPANVVAALEQTTVLGENFVQLQVPRRPGPLLAEGATIGRTRVVPEVEQLVAAGAQVFGSVSTAQLAQIIAAGGQGFGGEAASLRGLLNSLSDVTAGYAGRTRQITAAVASLDQLGTSLSPTPAPTPRPWPTCHGPSGSWPSSPRASTTCSGRSTTSRPRVAASSSSTTRRSSRSSARSKRSPGSWRRISRTWPACSSSSRCTTPASPRPCATTSSRSSRT